MLASYFWMDGYGPYVWSAWCVAGISLTGFLALAVVRHRDARRELSGLTNGERGG